MLRLGNDRQSFRLLRVESGGLADGVVLLRVLGPPYFTLLRALDRNGTDVPCAYTERAPGVRRARSEGVCV